MTRPLARIRCRLTRREWAGVAGMAALIQDSMEAGRRRIDFLRGDEPYKYQWGAVDEPVQRLLTLRSAPG